MADSDDEYDRKRRDKFRGERTESYSRESRRGSSSDSRRDEWNERYVNSGSNAFQNHKAGYFHSSESYIYIAFPVPGNLP